MRWVNSSFYLLVSIFWLITPFSNFSFKLPHLAKILPIFTPSRILWAFGEVGPCHVFGFVRCFFCGSLRAVFLHHGHAFHFHIWRRKWKCSAQSSRQYPSSMHSYQCSILSNTTIVNSERSYRNQKQGTNMRSTRHCCSHCRRPVAIVADITILARLSPGC
jgi:hypothetical protein